MSKENENSNNLHCNIYLQAQQMNPNPEGNHGRCVLNDHSNDHLTRRNYPMIRSYEHKTTISNTPTSSSFLSSPSCTYNNNKNNHNINNDSINNIIKNNND